LTETLYYTVNEVARLFRVTERTVKNRAEKGLYPGATKIGGDWLFDREKLEATLGRKLPEPQREGFE